MQINVAVAYHSGYGHTAKQAAAVAAGAEKVPDTRVHLLSLAELNDELWAALQEADAVVFGTPTYMGGSSAVFRTFVEATSQVWGDNMRWKNKIAGGFTNSGNMAGDKLNALIDIALFAAQHGMIWVGLAEYGGWNTSSGSPEDINRLGSWLGAMSQSNNDEGPDVTPCAGDLRTAEALGRRIAETAHVHRAGRAAVSLEDVSG
ncbi:NAD(P)H--quinone oxidoreductase WrbA [Streptomyces sp. NBRC 110611]|uniref:NAD(P)H-dependent oxidoreductase n=1 Tax=Streptomyces sp. NBRC 110611 TaxID=1621259 RepID=UPI000830AFC0|nr:NAD(P)H-dependent oxidoreductase [Streptomyces sp. NBRC 110611]GAU69228.1 NAD(P)H--quinone oxidoreductase WrbA [Streptomyces sp. NBRC 110611]